MITLHIHTHSEQDENRSACLIHWKNIGIYCVVYKCVDTHFNNKKTKKKKIFCPRLKSSSVRMGGWKKIKDIFFSLFELN